MSISILVSGAGIVSLGGTADASKLAKGDPNMARRPWMEAFAALPGGALLVLVSGIVENKYIKYMRTRYILYMT